MISGSESVCLLIREGGLHGHALTSTSECSCTPSSEPSAIAGDENNKTVESGMAVGRTPFPSSFVAHDESTASLASPGALDARYVAAGTVL